MRPGSRRSSVGHSAHASPSPRRLTVLAHVVGAQGQEGRCLERDIEADTREGLVRELEGRLGVEVHNATYFDREAGGYVPLPGRTDALPRNVELTLHLGRDRGASVASSAMAAMEPRAAPTYRQRLHAEARRLLARGHLTRHELATATKATVETFCDARGVDGGASADLTEGDVATLQRLVASHLRPGDDDSIVSVTHSASLVPAEVGAEAVPAPSRARRADRPARAAQPDADPDAAVPDRFVSVMYTVAGRLPRGPFAPDTGIAATLAPPVLSGMPHEEVVLTGSVTARGPVALCWWLAYGPRRTVLNLDKMYASRLVATYQVSELSFVLCFKGGALAVGWDYVVHLHATDTTTGAVAEVQAPFVVPGPPGSTVPAAAQVRRADLALGYSADAEAGPSAAIPTYPVTSAAASGQATPRSASLASGAVSGRASNGAGAPAASADSTRGSSRPSAKASQAPRSAAPSVAAPSEAPAPAAPPAKVRPFPEQVQDFVRRQVEPLYGMSSRPALSEAEFRGCVRDVALRYVMRYPASAVLDDDVKRALVGDVKGAIAAFARP